MQWQLVVKSTAPDTSLQNRLHENAGLQEEKYSLQTPVAEPSPKPAEPVWKRNVLMETDSEVLFPTRRFDSLHMFHNIYLPDRRAVFSVTFLDTKPGAEQRTQDVSQEKDGSVVAWAVERPKQDWRCYGWGNMPQTTYDLFIAADGGINGKVACSRLFCSCSNLNHIHFNGHFHTIDATDMSYMFFETKPKSLDLSSIQTTNVTNMSCMFFSCIMDASLDLSGFDTSHVTNMSSMFSNFSSSSLILTGFNTANVENMAYMFSGCRVSKLDLSSFQTHNVKDVTAMFRDCDAQLTLVNPDVRKVEKYMAFDDRHHSFRGFMDDAKLVNGRDWIELFGGRRFEVTAPMRGTITKQSENAYTGKTVRKGQLLATISFMGIKKEVYSPCDGVIVRESAYQGCSRRKNDVLFIIYERKR